MEAQAEANPPSDTFHSINICETDEKEHNKSGNEQKEDMSAEEDPPDGGWGWMVTFSAFYINIVIMGTHNCFGLLYFDLTIEFKGSLSKTAWIGSIAFGCILIFAPFSAYLANKFGCRKVTIAGILIASSSLFVSSYANSISMLYFTYGFGYGFGTSLCYMQGAVMVARYFSSRRALASGIGLAGSSLGALVMAPCYNRISHAYRNSEDSRNGWRVALKVIAGLTVTCLLCAATYTPLRKPGASTHEERVKSSPARRFVLDLSLWKNKAFVVWAIAVGLCKIGYLVPWVHMVKLAEDVNGSPLFGTQLLQYMGVCATASRLLVGKIVDSPHINRLFVSQFSAFMMGVVNIIQAYTRTYAGMISYAVMLGVLDGGVEILLPIMTLDLVGAEQLSIAWGCILAVISVSCMGPPIAGAIRDTSPDKYLWAFYFAGIPMILSALVLCLIPMWARRQNQNPEQSIMSIHPSFLEIMADSSKPALCARLPKTIHRIYKGKGKYAPTESTGQLISSVPMELTRCEEEPGTSDCTNKKYPLPGNW